MINRKITASQIKNLFRESAKGYHEFYEERIQNFSRKRDYPFVCWNESDLRTYIIHLFSQQNRGKTNWICAFRISN